MVLYIRYFVLIKNITEKVKDYEYYNRPESQGGTWLLAQKMKIIKEIDKQNLHIKN
jgi:hypothetical protein